MNDDNDSVEYDTIIRLSGSGKRHFKHRHHNSVNANNGQQHKYYPTSGQAGKRCRNAMTGVEYAWRVGTTAALDNLFHSVDTTGKCDAEGFLISAKSQKYGVYPNPNPNHLYYDSPEQFMRHQRILLNPELVKRWRERHQQVVQMATDDTE